MNFWGAFGIYLVACVAVVLALSINGRTEQPAGDHGHGHDDHGHGHH
ncbi:MAG: hypothetical protein K0R39_1793 [Symbiobacteriaceae bacterium]|jgi:hypothetical protein|nr:hypothetical protein [Symbiobacteriaceae bacterium]